MMTLNEAYENDGHDERSIRLFEYIAHLDYSEGDDAFGFSSGGDGDNGEQLMFLLDCYFANVIDKDEGYPLVRDGEKA